MKIYLVGDFSGHPDEGMKQVSYELSRRLKSDHDVISLDPRRLKISEIRKLRTLSPDIIHYIHGPTIRSLILLKIFKWVAGRDARTIVSATKPYFPRTFHRCIRFFKPDLILTQSDRFEKLFLSQMCRTIFVPNGIDTRRFHPVASEKKTSLKKKHGIPTQSFMVLHVGHFKKVRNLLVLKEMKESIEGSVFIVVGGTSMPEDHDVRSDLEKSGIKVWRRYFKNIEEVYQMADCFVFPTKDTPNKELPKNYNQIGAIDLPLSVLEAMSCNLPVLTTRFGVLPRLFKEGPGFYYCDTTEDFIRGLSSIREGEAVRTRRMVQNLDWDNIVDKLDKIYRQLLDDRLQTSGKKKICA